MFEFKHSNIFESICWSEAFLCDPEAHLYNNVFACASEELPSDFFVSF